ncbi:YciE/YciF ferroxidase family protein [Catalinimonas niigatensis]|uniref:YciE/YciF ferroxidase family protein n=1 Tax=Catalinimonas niigatensis TaxID=1397264 RepID=UPI0026650507|nr:DUF892 family protein [Catalinimonas niigatensis]WPP49805.1 DUF892 family protein [Catalinimonas niigatensis]
MKFIQDLNELLVEQLKEQNDGERQQLEAFPKLRERTSSNELQKSIDHQLGTKRKHLQRIEQIFSLLQRNFHGEINKGVKGLLEEAEELAVRCTDAAVRDAGIITSIQHLCHHNMASYGTLSVFAKELRLLEIKELLGESLSEEKEIDLDLSILAKTHINPKAIH